MASKLFPAIAVGFGAVAVIATAWFIFSSNQDTKAALQAAAEQPSIPVKPTNELTPQAEDRPALEISTEPEAFPEPELPIIDAPVTLDNSDPQVMLAIADFAPAMTQWLLPKEQLRKWVLTVDMIADGKLPRRYKPVDFPMGKFFVSEKGADTVVAESNYQRANTLITAITSIDPEILARYYQSWLPILEKAYAEQGRTDTFEQRLQLAISQVLAANPPPSDAELIRPSVLYEYADPTLESASDVEKILWRLGEDNGDSIQNFLREFRYQISQ